MKSTGASKDELYDELYTELKRLARSQLRREHQGFTLSATDLVHDSWLRLSVQAQTQVNDQNHFKALVAMTIRRILIDHARAKQATKRDGITQLNTQSDLDQFPATQNESLLQIHEALIEFNQIDPRAAQIVELKFFGGLETAEISLILDVSEATVKRDWFAAKAWLSEKLV